MSPHIQNRTFDATFRREGSWVTLVSKTTEEPLLLDLRDFSAETRAKFERVPQGQHVRVRLMRHDSESISIDLMPIPEDDNGS
jgi:hypothetical protein